VPRGEGLGEPVRGRRTPGPRGESRCSSDVGCLPTPVPGLALSRLEILRLLRALGSRRTLERDLSPGRSAQRGGVPGGPELRIHGLTRERLCVPLNSVYRRGDEGHGGSSRDGKSVG
jgi:hypothetical protein